MAIDLKYGLVTVENEPGNPFGDDEPVLILRGRDRLAPKAIVAYVKLCMMDGTERPHLDLLLDAHGVFVAWQEANPTLVKQPD